MEKKTEISEYHISSPKKLMKIIHERLIDKKPLNSVKY